MVTEKTAIRGPTSIPGPDSLAAAPSWTLTQREVQGLAQGHVTGSGPGHPPQSLLWPLLYGVGGDTRSPEQQTGAQTLSAACKWRSPCLKPAVCPSGHWVRVRACITGEEEGSQRATFGDGTLATFIKMTHTCPSTEKFQFQKMANVQGYSRQPCL